MNAGDERDGTPRHAGPAPGVAGAARPPRRWAGAAAAGLKRALPWLIAAAVLGYVFRTVPFAEAVAAAEGARLGLFVPAALLGVTVWFWLESTAFAHLFSRFNAPLSRRQARSLRAVTYLLTPINWNLGTGAIILHLRQSRGIAAIDATSSLFYYGLIDGIVLSGLALAGILALPPSPAGQTVLWVAGGFLGLQTCLLLFFMLPLPAWRWVTRARAVRVFRTHSLATWRDATLLLLIRGLYFGGFVLFFWAGTQAFGVAVPLTYLAAAVPVILMVGAIPITPAGLGTQQAAMLYFFDAYGSDAQILAYGLAFPVALIVARLPIAAFYVRDLGALRSPRGGAGPR